MILAPFGRELTPMQVLAGYGAENISEYMEFIVWKSFMSVRYTVTDRIPPFFTPASVRMATRLPNATRICSSVPFGIKPLLGSMGICPETNTLLPDMTA
jgi:hypothetical protein